VHVDLAHLGRPTIRRSTPCCAAPTRSESSRSRARQMSSLPRNAPTSSTTWSSRSIIRRGRSSAAWSGRSSTPTGPRPGRAPAPLPGADPRAHPRRAALPGGSCCASHGGRGFSGGGGRGAAPRHGLQALGRAHADDRAQAARPAWRRAASSARPRTRSCSRSPPSPSTASRIARRSFALMPTQRLPQALPSDGVPDRPAQRLADGLLPSGDAGPGRHPARRQGVAIDVNHSAWRCTWEKGDRHPISTAAQVEGPPRGRLPSVALRLLSERVASPGESRPPLPTTSKKRDRQHFRRFRQGCRLGAALRAGLLRKPVRAIARPVGPAPCTARRSQYRCGLRTPSSGPPGEAAPRLLGLTRRAASGRPPSPRPSPLFAEQSDQRGIDSHNLEARARSRFRCAADASATIISRGAPPQTGDFAPPEMSSWEETRADFNTTGLTRPPSHAFFAPPAPRAPPPPRAAGVPTVNGANGRFGHRPASAPAPPGDVFIDPRGRDRHCPRRSSRRNAPGAPGTLVPASG